MNLYQVILSPYLIYNPIPTLFPGENDLPLPLPKF